MIIIYVLLIFLSLVLIWHFLTKKYISPYKLYVFIGKKGAGKSSYIAKKAKWFIDHGYNVYCNCDDIKINGVHIFKTQDIGKYDMHDAIVFIDEISVFFDNRTYKQTSAEFIQWLRYMRHYKLIVYAFSQSYDMDKKIRVMADGIYIMRKYLRIFSISRMLDKNIAIKESALDCESQIVDELKFVPFFLPAATQFVFIPKYVRYFDSFKQLHHNQLPLPFKLVTDGFNVNRYDYPTVDEKDRQITFKGIRKGLLHFLASSIRKDDGIVNGSDAALFTIDNDVSVPDNSDR